MTPTRPFPEHLAEGFQLNATDTAGLVPLGVVGALLAATGRGLTNDVYFQVGLITMPKPTVVTAYPMVVRTGPNRGRRVRAASMAAFSASTLVCSVMSEISSVISPISWDDSPSRLIRLEVSWIWSRIEFMPPMAFCTACPLAPFTRLSIALTIMSDWSQ